MTLNIGASQNKIGVNTGVYASTVGVQTVPAVQAAPALTVGFGPTQLQTHGAVNQAAIKGFVEAIATEPLTEVEAMVPRQGSVPRPWEDMRNEAVHSKGPTITAKDLGDRWVFEGRRGTLDKVLGEWSSTTHAQMWTTPLGQAIAAFAVSRYGQAALQFDGRGKLQHVVEVLNNADRITLDQAAIGEKLAPQWRVYLEYAALLHDIGYMNGGAMHPKKGGNDMMYHLRSELKKHGVDDSAVSDVDIEKMSLIVELHGDAFPWSKIGDATDQKRLAGSGGFGAFPYLSLDLVDKTFAQPGRTEQFVDIMREENKVYIAEKGGLQWLSDPAQVRELIRTGYVMHAADKYKGPSGDQIGTRIGTTPGLSAPLTTFADTDEFLRVLDNENALGGLASSICSLTNQVIAQVPFAERASLQKKLEGFAQSLRGIADIIGTIEPTDSNAHIASSLIDIANSKFVVELDGVVQKMPADTAACLKAVVDKTGAPSLSHFIAFVIDAAAISLT
jgi:hypothetical protein